jgi:hypothetical protein
MINTTYKNQKRREKTKMKQDDFKRERLYQVTLAIVRLMHTKNVIAASDLLRVEILLLEKYKPLLGCLYSTNARIHEAAAEKGNLTQNGGVRQ